MTTSVCETCGNSEGNRLHVAKEMMFGFRDEFEYVECSVCGSLQIANVPSDLSKYYPSNYYSFQAPTLTLGHPITSAVKKHLMRYLLGHPDSIVWPVAKRIAVTYSWLQGLGLGLDSRILDVGCGAGRLLLGLQRHGFTRLVGVDPFTPNDFVFHHVRVFKQEISELDGQFDLIKLHHVLEHMPGHRVVFKELFRLLAPGGNILIRTPVCGTFAWKHYGVNWVQLDPPRHLAIHSLRSLRLQAQHANLRVTRIVFDSTEFQFRGSEQYLRNVPLTASQSAPLFPKRAIRRFASRAAELNAIGEGDQAIFYLAKCDDRRSGDEG